MLKSIHNTVIVLYVCVYMCMHGCVYCYHLLKKATVLEARATKSILEHGEPRLAAVTGESMPCSTIQVHGLSVRF